MSTRQFSDEDLALLQILAELNIATRNLANRFAQHILEALPSSGSLICGEALYCLTSSGGERSLTRDGHAIDETVGIQTAVGFLRDLQTDGFRALSAGQADSAPAGVPCQDDAVLPGSPDPAIPFPEVEAGMQNGLYPPW
ncbi:MAG: hypothetical protein KGJ93_01170 [Patescibacteria group bacterium]|nr:hypothetical protein [Patescibacteria group bacterium]